jgi:hypothetical protein
VFSNKERVRAAKKAGKESYFDRYSKVGPFDKEIAKSVSRRSSLVGLLSLTPFSAFGQTNRRWSSSLCEHMKGKEGMIRMPVR